MSDVIIEPLHASYDMNHVCINGHLEDETDDSQSVEKINNIILLCEKVQKDVLSQPLPHCSSLMLEKSSPKRPIPSTSRKSGSESVRSVILGISALFSSTVSNPPIKALDSRVGTTCSYCKYGGPSGSFPSAKKLMTLKTF